MRVVSSRRPLRAALASVLAVVLAAPAAVPVLAQPQLTTPYPAVAVAPGDSTTFALTVRPEAPARVTLAVEGVPDGWQATIRGGGFTVDAVFADPDEPPEVE